MTLPFGRRAGLLVAIAMSAFVFNVTESLPIGLLQPMAADLGTSLTAIGLLVSAYGVAVAVLSLPLAHWIRAWPRRWVLTGVLGALAVASATSVAAVSYPVLFGSRLVIAAAQALFWAVMTTTAAGLFPPSSRGRVMGVLSTFATLAIVLGVPAGTWLGQQTGWRVPFALAGAVALVVAGLIAALLPTSRPEDSHAAYGTTPDRRRFAIALATTTLTVTGLFTGYTYVTEYLHNAAGIAPDSVGVMLFVYGLAGLGGVTLAGQLLDGRPRGVLLTAVGLQAVAMTALYAYPWQIVVVVCALALLGASGPPVFMATQARMLQFSPGRTEIGFAANSGAFNVGIASGALLGGALLPGAGVRIAFLAGAVVTAAALALLLAEPARRGRPHPAPGRTRHGLPA
ncbi:putative MFS family arabinose efflux permease [Catenuloplanes nepalensis]|uniref:MFS family arabinose efflux permease n=1 Tax=Catenuloplanes nepalensis TaxID=587533 RepID=A0ABT9MTR9_9ACTN|nr:MFS transporter [Catenuloplanes nepalensis]MDP9794829.1 putative MFS family arabinose efflux permease [Catenuloplanes nepalensis]